jgi:helix-turn-helix protein
MRMIKHKSQLPPQPSLKQTAEFFDVDVTTVRRWIAQGRLARWCGR